MEATKVILSANGRVIPVSGDRYLEYLGLLAAVGVSANVTMTMVDEPKIEPAVPFDIPLPKIEQPKPVEMLPDVGSILKSLAPGQSCRFFLKQFPHIDKLSVLAHRLHNRSLKCFKRGGYNISSCYDDGSVTVTRRNMGE